MEWILLIHNKKSKVLEAAPYPLTLSVSGNLCLTMAPSNSARRRGTHTEKGVRHPQGQRMTPKHSRDGHRRNYAHDDVVDAFGICPPLSIAFVAASASGRMPHGSNPHSDQSRNPTRQSVGQQADCGQMASRNRIGGAHQWIKTDQQKAYMCAFLANPINHPA